MLSTSVQIKRAEQILSLLLDKYTINIVNKEYQVIIGGNTETIKIDQVTKIN